MLYPHALFPHVKLLCSFSGGGPPVEQTISSMLELVGEAASHMAAEIANDFESTGAYAGEAAADLPPVT